MKANNSLRINMSRALKMNFFFSLGHGPTYPISDLSGSAITRGNCTLQFSYLNDSWSRGCVAKRLNSNFHNFGGSNYAHIS